MTTDPIAIRNEICEKIMFRYEKKTEPRIKGGYKPLTKAEINMFRKMGSKVTEQQQSLF